MNFTNSRHLKGWLKKQLPTWKNEDRLLITPKQGYKYGYVVIVDDKLFQKWLYDRSSSWEIDIPKLREYLDGRPYDKASYWQIYGEGAPDVIYRFEAEYGSKLPALELLRSRGLDVGVREVPKPEDGVWIDEGRYVADEG